MRKQEEIVATFASYYRPVQIVQLRLKPQELFLRCLYTPLRGSAAISPVHTTRSALAVCAWPNAHEK
jgi:hypothetical protein